MSKIICLLCLTCSICLFASSAHAKKSSWKAVQSPSDKSPDPDLLYIEGRQKVLDGDYEAAIPLLEKAQASSPKDPFVNDQLAELYLRVSDFDKAEAAAKLAVDADPKNADYRMTLGGIYATEKKYDEARAQYEKVGELEPENQKAPLLIGILESEAGHPEAGVKKLSQLIDQSSDNVMALFYRAKIYLEMDQVDKAEADLERCLTARPNFVEAGTALGLLYERTNKSDKAISAYERIDGNGTYRKRLANLYLEQNDIQKALTQLLQYQSEQPDDYTARVKIGLIYFELKDFKKAHDTFSAVLKEQPEADNVRFYLGWVDEEEKHWDTALNEFQKVGKDSELFKEAMLHAGLIYKQTDRTHEGIEFSKRIISKNPGVSEFYDLEASFYESQKSYAQALGVIQAGLKALPKDERLMYYEGALYDKMGKKSDGIATMKQLLSLDPNNPHALNFLGYTYAEMGKNLDEAETLVKKAIALRPNDGYIQDSLGWILYKKGDTDDAIAQLEKAASLEPGEPIILEHLGDAYQSKKNYAKAADAYKRAVAFSVTKKDSDMQRELESRMASLSKVRVPTNDSSK